MNLGTAHITPLSAAITGNKHADLRKYLEILEILSEADQPRVVKLLAGLSDEERSSFTLAMMKLADSWGRHVFGVGKPTMLLLKRLEMGFSRTALAKKLSVSGLSATQIRKLEYYKRADGDLSGKFDEALRKQFNLPMNELLKPIDGEIIAAWCATMRRK